MYAAVLKTGPHGSFFEFGQPLSSYLLPVVDSRSCRSRAFDSDTLELFSIPKKVKMLGMC